MAWISKYGLHIETITFPGGLQQAKTGKSGGEGDRKTMTAWKKRVPATDVSTHGKMQWLTISFASQLTSGTGIFSSFLKESVVNWGKGHLASHNCKSYKALPNTNAFLWAIHRFSQVHDSWIGLPSPLISHKSSCNTKMNREWTSSYTKFTIALLHPKKFSLVALPLSRLKDKQLKSLSHGGF